MAILLNLVKMAAKTNAAVTGTDKCCNIIRNLNLVHIIRTRADHYHFAETIENQLRNITIAKIRILIKKNSTEHGNARRYR